MRYLDTTQTPPTELAFAAALPAHKLRPGLLPIVETFDPLPPRHAHTIMIDTIEADQVVRHWQPTPLPVPNRVERMKLQVVLAALPAPGHSSMLAAIEAYIATLAPDDPRAIGWRTADGYERVSPAWDAMGALFGLTPAQIDEIWWAAYELTLP